jgi:putative copper export protein
MAVASGFGNAVAGAGPVFLAFLITHVLAGLTAVISGLLAATAPKRRGRHTRFGTVYYWALAVVSATAVAMTAMRPARDWYLALLGALAYLLATVGRHARRRPGSWPWRDRPASHAPHIATMSGSYTVLLTAFYVDNGKNLPLWDRLPVVAYWLLPAIVAAPIIARSIHRHRGPPVGRAKAPAPAAE